MGWNARNTSWKGPPDQVSNLVSSRRSAREANSSGGPGSQLSMGAGEMLRSPSSTTARPAARSALTRASSACSGAHGQCHAVAMAAAHQLLILAAA